MHSPRRSSCLSFLTPPLVIPAWGAIALADRKPQETIGRFGVDKLGAPLFFPDAGKKTESLAL